MASQPVGLEANLRRIPVIGIVGGIGSGKSAVANWVAAHANIEVVDADVLGHEALKDSQVKEALCRCFGRSILDANHEVDRSAVARLVFGPTESHRAARHELEQIVHPEIRRRISERVERAALSGRSTVLLDAAVLLEAGWSDKCDSVVFIDTPDADRVSRVLENRGWSAEELRRRESSQWTLTDKRRRADIVVENKGTIQQAGQQLVNALEERGLATFAPRG